MEINISITQAKRVGLTVFVNNPVTLNVDIFVVILTSFAYNL